MRQGRLPLILVFGDFVDIQSTVLVGVGAVEVREFLGDDLLQGEGTGLDFTPGELIRSVLVSSCRTIEGFPPIELPPAAEGRSVAHVNYSRERSTRVRQEESRRMVNRVSPDGIEPRTQGFQLRAYSYFGGARGGYLLTWIQHEVNNAEAFWTN